MDEDKPYLLIYFKNNINSILQQPFTHTQRIKYISYDISQSYIILGASSGGLYVFRREPCTFIQIIPNQEGAVEHISISPNEKYISFSTVKKCLCIIQLNSLSKSSKCVYRDNFEHPIKCLKWNLFSSELFLGDTVGQISVIIIADFLAKTMFQPSCYPLMRLDSEIVQLDWNSTLLLVSTLSRCYICDTEREEYRQAGQKLRDGDYGACFINRNESDTSIVLNSTENRKKGWFTSKTVENQNPLVSYSYYQHLKVFCSRPGGRLWEVQIDGTVFRTIQFKDACLQQPLSDVILYNNSTDLRLELLSQNTSEVPHSVNFSKLYLIKKQFIITYKKDLLYILDPEITSVITWCNCPNDIQDIRVIGSYIYIRDCYDNISCVHFIEMEKLLLRSFINKQYLFCADLCLKYYTYLLNLIPKSNKLYLISSLCEKLDIQSHADLINNLEPLLKVIKDDTLHRQKHTQSGEINNGIVIVDNIFYNVNKDEKNDVGGFYEQNTIVKQNGDEENVEDVNQVSLRQDCTDMDDKFVENEENKVSEQHGETVNNSIVLEDNILNYSNIKPVNIPKVVTPSYSNHNRTSGDLNIDILYEYFKLSKISKVLNCKSIDDILSTYSKILEIHDFVLRLQSYMIEMEANNYRFECDLWCYNVFLRYLKIHPSSILLQCFENGDVLKQYLINAFININLSIELACSCTYPLSDAYQFKGLRYMEIGVKMIELLWSKDDKCSVYLICSKVPYMWREVIRLSETKSIPLLLQFNDPVILENNLKSLEEHEIRELLNYFIKLQRQKCLFCDNKMHNCNTMNWTQFGLILLKVLGSELTLKYLIEYSTLIPSGSFDCIFYQLCFLNENGDTLKYYYDLAETNPQLVMKNTEDRLLRKLENISLK